MKFHWYALATLCVAGSVVHAQEAEQNRPPFQVNRERGFYTTKKPVIAPSAADSSHTPPTLPDKIPFGRASSDALIPVPNGPRVTASAPVPGVESGEVIDAVEAEVIANDLPEAVINPTAPTAQTSAIFEDKDVAPRPVELRALNKVTGLATTMTIQPGESETFGNLTILARVCRKAIQDSQPDSAALLEIEEKKPEETVPKQLFSGWMFASSPSLTGLEHPVYDISVVHCATNGKAAKTSDKHAPSS
jgi:hypothetical protein